MKYFILMGLSFQCFGASLTSMDIEIEKAVRTNRSRNIPDNLEEPTKNYLNLNFQIELAKKVYWRNKISSEITANQFRYIALDFDLEYNLSKRTDIYYRHYSGHVLDYQPRRNFREENSVGIRFKLK